jgi:hypothetical protein
MLIDILTMPIIRQQAILLRLMKQLLPPTMSIEKMIAYIKSNRVVVIVENARVAQQWIYIKKTILEKIKEKIPSIKDIHIQIEPQEKEQDVAQHIQPCQRCGTLLLRKGETLCALCTSSILDIERQRVFQFLQEAPWIRYEELEEKDKKLIDYEGFMRERTFQIKRIYDKIDLEYWAWHRTKDPKSLNRFIIGIQEYVITKLNIHPQDLTPDTIKANVPARWYKQYVLRSE